MGFETEVFGRSSRGSPTKIHVRADEQRHSLGLALTGGEVSDSVVIPDLLAIPDEKPKLFLADKGMPADFLREELPMHGIRPVMRPKANRKKPPAGDFGAYRNRNRIGRMFKRM